ncbi:uncharacterized protein LOC105702341 [Orussus abietinus]|uniref:uncharacterized protein LOC105702341 n=1 Tax=Orussus abietinus TaxID=222816 RepID=UPI0006268EEB|nr:uncharacterized protein LOC105702341 [Orussus abietinus]
MCDPPPRMRGLLTVQIKRNLITAAIFAATNALLFRIFYVNPKQKRIREYYLNYDPDVSEELMAPYLHTTYLDKEDEAEE